MSIIEQRLGARQPTRLLTGSVDLHEAIPHLGRQETWASLLRGYECVCDASHAECVAWHGSPEPRNDLERQNLCVRNVGLESLDTCVGNACCKIAVSLPTSTYLQLPLAISA